MAAQFGLSEFVAELCRLGVPYLEGALPANVREMGFRCASRHCVLCVSPVLLRKFLDDPLSQPTQGDQFLRALMTTFLLCFYGVHSSAVVVAGPFLELAFEDPRQYLDICHKIEEVRGRLEQTRRFQDYLSTEPLSRDHEHIAHEARLCIASVRKRYEAEGSDRTLPNAERNDRTSEYSLTRSIPADVCQRVLAYLQVDGLIRVMGTAPALRDENPA